MDKQFLKKYKYVVAAFFVGLAVLVLPIPKKQKVDNLPTTGERSQLSLTINADKEHVQVADENIEKRKIDYKVVLSNDAKCKQVKANVVLALDSSGSMQNCLFSAKDDLKNLYYHLDNGDHTIFPIKFGEQVSKIYTEDFESEVELIEPTGLTDLASAVRQSMQMLSETEENATIVLFTDGRTDLPKDSSKQSASSYLRLAASKGIQIIVFEYGRHADSEFLKTLTTSNGTYFQNPSEQQVSQAASQITHDRSQTSEDSKVQVDLNLIKDSLKDITVKNGGEVSEGMITWNIGDILCQESVELKFSLLPGNEVEDLETFDLIALARNAEGAKLQSDNFKTTLHAPKLDVSFDSISENILPGEELKLVFELMNKGTGNIKDLNVKASLVNNNLIIKSEGLGNKLSSSGQVINFGKVTLDGSFDPVGYGTSKSFSYDAKVRQDMSDGVHGYGYEVDLNKEGTLENSFKLEKALSYGCDMTVSSQLNDVLSTNSKGVLKATLRNNGIKACENVEIRFNYPNEVLEIISSGNINTANDVAVYTFDSSIAGGESKVFEVGFQTNNVVMEQIQSIITQVSADDDIDTNNDSSLVKFNIEESPTLESSINSQKRSVFMDEIILVNVSIKNISNVEADDVTLELTLPETINYVPYSTYINDNLYREPTGTSQPVWSVGKVSSEETKKMQMSFSSLESGQVSLQGKLLWNGGETNSVANVNVVQRKADLEGIELAENKETFTQRLPFNLGKLMETGNNTTLYLKILFGLILIIPLPILLMVEGRKRDKKSEGKKKK